MQRYIPNTEAQQKEMLAEAGFGSFNELYADIPENMRLSAPLSLPAPLGEPQLLRRAKELAKKNVSAEDTACFLGGGAYDHFIPSAVERIVSREEFYTAYTPYQPEISEGTLQAIFEYQSMICMLTGMDVSNASMYDGATALAEAAMMACTAQRRGTVAVSAGVNPESLAVLRTYAQARGKKLVMLPLKDGRTDTAALAASVGPDTAAVIIQSPNFYGLVEDFAAAADIAHGCGALAVEACEPFSLALLKSPGELGADAAVGEGQPLGGRLNCGGPYFGFFAVKKPLMRKMPGRIAGMTKDTSGRRGFVLTLQAREQHIRREKATSNICSNEALNALTAAVYLSVLGKEGFEEAAHRCLDNAHYAHDRLLESGAFEEIFPGPFFMEFALKYRGDLNKLEKALARRGITGGLDVGRRYPESGLENVCLIAVTEKRTREEIDEFADIAGRTAAER
jgi:glycine dehydrogenase subunit 1